MQIVIWSDSQEYCDVKLIIIKFTDAMMKTLQKHLERIFILS